MDGEDRERDARAEQATGLGWRTGGKQRDLRLFPRFQVKALEGRWCWENKRVCGKENKEGAGVV